MKFEEWHRPIVFEGVELPGVAIAIDHLGMYGNLPGLPENTSDWLWRFTICVGVNKAASSEEIIQHASCTLELAEKHREDLLHSVPKQYGSEFDSDVLDAWLWTLRELITIAQTRTTCQWSSPTRPGDRNYGKSSEDVKNDLLRVLDRLEDNLARDDRNDEH